MKKLWIFFFFFFWGGGGWSLHNWTIFGGHFYTFYGIFLRSRYEMGIFFRGGGRKIANICGRMPDIPDIFLG